MLSGIEFTRRLSPRSQGLPWEKSFLKIKGSAGNLRMLLVLVNGVLRFQRCSSIKESKERTHNIDGEEGKVYQKLGLG